MIGESAFYLSAGNQSLKPHAHVGSTLLTDPSIFSALGKHTLRWGNHLNLLAGLSSVILVTPGEKCPCLAMLWLCPKGLLLGQWLCGAETFKRERLVGGGPHWPLPGCFLVIYLLCLQKCSVAGGSAAQEPSPAWCHPLWPIQPSKLSSL